MAIAVTLTHISQRLDTEVVALGNLIWRCISQDGLQEREREKQFALFPDVVIHRYKFSNRPFCIS